MKSLCFQVMCGLLFLTSCSMTANDDAGIVSRVKAHLYDIGTTINKTQVPLFGALGNILPFAVVSFCLQKFPEQTMLALTGYGMYVLGKSDRTRTFLQKHNWSSFFTKAKKKNNKCRGVQLTDDFFVFDGDDLLDAEEQEDYEEEMLYERDKMAANKATIKKNSEV